MCLDSSTTQQPPQKGVTIHPGVLLTALDRTWVTGCQQEHIRQLGYSLPLGEVKQSSFSLLQDSKWQHELTTLNYSSLKNLTMD
jgi:hypothetical protein